jgi:hypothetical protein
LQEDPPYISSSEKEVSVPPPPPRPKNPVFEDEERSRLLQKLLRSKNPDDLQAANRLIKTMVKEVLELRYRSGMCSKEDGTNVAWPGCLVLVCSETDLSVTFKMEMKSVIGNTYLGAFLLQLLP